MSSDNNGGDAVAQAFETVRDSEQEEIQSNLDAALQLMTEFITREKAYVEYAEARPGANAMMLNIDLSQNADAEAALDRAANACVKSLTENGPGRTGILGRGESPFSVYSKQVVNPDQGMVLIQLHVNRLGM